MGRHRDSVDHDPNYKADAFGDPIDQACKIEQLQRDLMLEERKRNREAEENAHQAKDRFGRVICEECSGLIPAERLKAVPHAVYCVDCLSIFESNQRIYK